MSHEFESEPWISYGDESDGGPAIFVRRCPICFRFVKADETVRYNDFGLADEPNATCSKHGRVKMLFQGFGLD